MGCCSSPRVSTAVVAVLHLVGALGCMGLCVYLLTLNGAQLERVFSESWSLLTTLHLPVVVDAQGNVLGRGHASGGRGRQDSRMEADGGSLQGGRSAGNTSHLINYVVIDENTVNYTSLDSVIASAYVDYDNDSTICDSSTDFDCIVHSSNTEDTSLDLNQTYEILVDPFINLFEYNNSMRAHNSSNVLDASSTSNNSLNILTHFVTHGTIEDITASDVYKSSALPERQSDDVNNVLEEVGSSEATSLRHAVVRGTDNSTLYDLSNASTFLIYNENNTETFSEPSYAEMFNVTSYAEMFSVTSYAETFSEPTLLKNSTNSSDFVLDPSAQHPALNNHSEGSVIRASNTTLTTAMESSSNDTPQMTLIEQSMTPASASTTTVTGIEHPGSNTFPSVTEGYFGGAATEASLGVTSAESADNLTTKFSSDEVMPSLNNSVMEPITVIPDQAATPDQASTTPDPTARTLEQATTTPHQAARTHDQATTTSDQAAETYNSIAGTTDQPVETPVRGGAMPDQAEIKPDQRTGTATPIAVTPGQEIATPVHTAATLGQAEETSDQVEATPVSRVFVLTQPTSGSDSTSSSNSTFFENVLEGTTIDGSAHRTLSSSSVAARSSKSPAAALSGTIPSAAMSGTTPSAAPSGTTPDTAQSATTPAANLHSTRNSTTVAAENLPSAVASYVEEEPRYSALSDDRASVNDNSGIAVSFISSTQATVTIPPIATTTGFISTIFLSSLPGGPTELDRELSQLLLQLRLGAAVLVLLVLAIVCSIAAMLLLCAAILKMGVLMLPWLVLQWLLMLGAIGGVGLLTWRLAVAGVLLWCWWLVVLSVAGVVVLVLCLVLVMEAYGVLKDREEQQHGEEYEMNYITDKSGS